nr:putative ribonuclease H-like domain-containing protein [Tanacetum cinerariifolium]
MDLRWQMAMLTMRARRFLLKTGINLGANGPTSMGFDMSKVECYNFHRKGHFAREYRSPKDSRRTGAAELQRRTVLVETSTSNALVSESDCESWPPSSLYNRFQPSGRYHAVPPPYTGTFMPPKPDLVFNTPPTAVETDHLTFNIQLSPTKPEQDLSYTTRPVAPIIGDWVSDSEDKYETKALQFVPSFVQSSEQVKSPRHFVKPIETSIPAATPAPASPKSTSSGKRRNRKSCFVCKSVDHLIKDCDYHAKNMAQPKPRNYVTRCNHKQHASMTHNKSKKHMVPTAVLTQSKPILNTAIRPVSAVVPKISVTRPRYAHPVVTKSKSPIRRHITHSPSSKTSNSPPRVAIVKAPVDKGVIDSGCLRYMTGIMSYLSDFEELNGGYVSFGGNPKGGKISGKGKIKTGKLDFDDVYFIKELKFNLFRVLQMCDKKNSVLFTDTECLILSPNFKLPDESQVLLRVPRENNMYNVNLKNIVPSRDLTCLFAKATIDESNLWHRKLAHINFKTINKLVKDPLGKFEGKADEGFLNYDGDGDAAFDEKEHVFDAKKPKSEVILSSSSSAQSRKQDDKTKKEAKGNCLVESFIEYRYLTTKFKDCFDNSSNEVNAAGSIVPIVGQNSLNSTNTFSAAGPSNAVVSPTYGKSSFIDASQLPDDPDMPELEYITYSDNEDVVGAEADFNNLESSISISPIPTTRIHKDHPVSQIIGDLSSRTQTRSMKRVVKDQGFEDPDHPDKVYKVVKALYGLHQAPRAWYETLATYLLENGFQRGTIDQTLFIKKQKGDILLVQIYVDDIIFDATNKDLCKSFEKLMKDKFQMSSMGELTFFMGLQVKQRKDGIFISQDKYVAGILRKFGLTEGKSASTPIDTEKPLLKDPDGEDVDVHSYRSMIGQTTTGKEISNPFMAGSLPKTIMTTFIHVNDVTRLQALVDKKKVVITEAAIRESLSAKRTSWNEFSSAMASAVICLSTGRDTEEHVQDVIDDDAAHGDDTAAYGEVLTVSQEPFIPSPTPPTPLPQPPQDLPSTSQVQHTSPQSPQALIIKKLKRRVKKLEKGNRVKMLKLQRLKIVGTSQRVNTSEDILMDNASNQGRKIDELDKDDDVALMDDKEEDKKEEEAKAIRDDQVLSMQEDEPAKVHEVVDVVTTAKLITKVVTAASKTVTAASTTIFATEPQVPAATITAALKKQQVEMDEEYARKFHAELNKDIDWDTAIDHVKQKAKEDPTVLDYFKGMSYDDIPKRRKLNEEVEDLKRHLDIVPDKDDDVYTEATPLARKLPVVDYEIINLNNKPYYKIIQADGTHQLYISFLTLLKNFDREDLEALWSLVKERWTGSSLEESKDYTWSSKGQELEATGIMCAAKQKMMLLDSAAEGTLMLLSQFKTANDKCYCCNINEEMTK